MLKLKSGGAQVPSRRQRHGDDGDHDEGQTHPGGGLRQFAVKHHADADRLAQIGMRRRTDRAEAFQPCEAKNEGEPR